MQFQFHRARCRESGYTGPLNLLFGLRQARPPEPSSRPCWPWVRAKPWPEGLESIDRRRQDRRQRHHRILRAAEDLARTNKKPASWRSPTSRSPARNSSHFASPLCGGFQEPPPPTSSFCRPTFVSASSALFCIELPPIPRISSQTNCCPCQHSTMIHAENFPRNALCVPPRTNFRWQNIALIKKGFRQTKQ